MIYIEFFDENIVENICGCLASKPDKVILIGNDKEKLLEHRERYHSFFKNRGMDIVFTFRIIEYDDTKADMLGDVVDQLSKIVEKVIADDTCVIDLTGGQDLMLAAAGIVYDKYKDKNLQMHRFDLRSNELHNCDSNGDIITVKALPVLSAKELVKLYGGKIVYENEMQGTTYSWNWTNDFENDINKMWTICQKNVGAWNTQINVFAVAEKVKNNSSNPLETTASITRINEELKKEDAEYKHIEVITKALLHSGLITSFNSNNESISITFKNKQVKRCLTKAGQALEMKITLSARKAKDNKGNPVYNDVVNGAYIDWDGRVNKSFEGCDTDNEIDVLLMRGTVPVFVSCKNGRVDKEELYKLDTVAEQFGGSYAKKVLVATALRKNLSSVKSFIQRAEDMDITLVDNILGKTDKELQRIVGSFCSDEENPK